MSKQRGFALISLLALVAYAIIICLLSSMDGSRLPELNKYSLDKVAHFVEYLVLTLLVIRVLRGSWPRLGSFAASIFAMIFVIAFAALDERHQIMTPNRTCSLADFAADFMGSSAAILAFVYREDSASVDRKKMA